MPAINVVIESTLNGATAGFQGIRIDDSQTVGDLINQYCNAKEAPVESDFVLVTKNNVPLVNKQPIANFAIQDGATLRLTKSTPSTRLRFRQWLTMAALGMITGIVGICVCVFLYAISRRVPDNYAMVIDAGSTHTDMILYKWPGSKRNNTGEVTQVYMCSASGGVAQVAPDQIASYFDPCFKECFLSIKEESRERAEVLFGATAGMRLLNETDSAQAAAIISGIRNFLKNSDFNFRDTNAGIISGSVEGVSGWITINFVEQTVLKKVSVNGTFGAMDLGGASTQVSFEVPESLRTLPDVYPITLFGNKFYIFSQSYICYGVVQAFKRYWALLLMEQLSLNPDATVITSPCEPLNLTSNVTASNFTSFCSNYKFPRELKASDAWIINGTGNYAECKRVVSKLLDYNECTRLQLGFCVNPSQIPRDVIQRNYYAFAAYNYISTDLGFPHAPTMENAERHIKVMCDYTKHEIYYVKAQSQNKKRVYEHLCFEGRFMFTLLTELYGFNTEESWSQISFTSQVKGTTLGWSLGYMVNATEEIAASPPIPKLTVVPFSLLTVLFIVFLLLSFAFVVQGFKARKRSPSYQSSNAPSQKSVNSVL